MIRQLFQLYWFERSSAVFCCGLYHAIKILKFLHADAHIRLVSSQVLCHKSQEASLIFFQAVLFFSVSRRTSKQTSCDLGRIGRMESMIRGTPNSHETTARAGLSNE